MDDPANGCNQNEHDDDAERGGHSGVDARGGFDTIAVENGEDESEEDGPCEIRYFGEEVDGCAAAPDDADERVDDVVENETPASDVAEAGVNFFADVEECGAAVRVDAGHAAIADGGEEHGYHRQHDHGDDMTARLLVENAENRHRRGGLNEDDAVERPDPESAGRASVLRFRIEFGKWSPFGSLSGLRQLLLA